MEQLTRRQALIGAAATTAAAVVSVLPALPVAAAPASSAPTLLSQRSSIGWHGRWYVLDCDCGKALDRGQSVLDMIREREAFVAKFIGDVT